MSQIFDALVETMARLRAPGGCPWDREQTHQSIRYQLIEEAYETLKAIEDNNSAHLAEELGDLLLHIVFHAQIAEELQEFTLTQVIEGLRNKLIHRHPHVFSSATVKDSQEVIKNWEEIKMTETKKHSGTSYLDSVPDNLPALFEALKLSKKAAKIGFDWKETKHVLAKLDEEVMEVRAALQAGDNDQVKAEIGDLFFCIVNLARKLEIQPEEALRQTNKKFRTRFLFIEQALKQQNIALQEASIERLNELWEEAK